MKRCPLISAFCILGLIITILLCQQNWGTKDAVIRFEKIAQKTALKRSLQADRLHNLTASNPHPTESELESVSQNRVSVSLFDLLEETIKRKTHEPEKHFTKAVLNRTSIRVNWEALREIRESGSGILEINTGSGRLTTQVSEVIDNWGGGYSLSGNIDGRSSRHLSCYRA